jgi:hypothetical protein
MGPRSESGCYGEVSSFPSFGGLENLSTVKDDCKLFLVQFLHLQEDFAASQQMGDCLADPGEWVDGGHGHV